MRGDKFEKESHSRKKASSHQILHEKKGETGRRKKERRHNWRRTKSYRKIAENYWKKTQREKKKRETLQRAIINPRATPSQEYERSKE